MNKTIKQIKKKIKKNSKTIVFPEGEEERILKATEKILKQKIAKIILLGNKKKIILKIKKLKLKINFKKIHIINPLTSLDKEKYSNEFYNLRKHKKITLNWAKEKLKEHNYFGTMMVHQGDADGLISGAIHSTKKVLLPAFQIIGASNKQQRISSCFLVQTKDKNFLFADCAINISPDSKELADIVFQTSETAKIFNIKPRIAMLSFSTKGSAKHPLIKNVHDAVKIVNKKNPNLIIDGELQADAALSPFVSKIKCPTSKIKGNANILIFPDLQSANIGYKLVRHFGKTNSIGPIIQGIKKPINDLSRGCSVEEIVQLAIITVLQAQQNK